MVTAGRAVTGVRRAAPSVIRAGTEARYGIAAGESAGATMPRNGPGTRISAQARKGPAIFTRILCGIDETPEAIAAVRQARKLAAPAAEIVLVGVLETRMAVNAGWAATAVLEDLRDVELAALERAKAEAGPHARSRLLDGVPWSELKATAAEEQADLVAVGVHERRRAKGILDGNVATYTLHEAPCSVLVAREAEEPDRFPRSIVAGFDGSECGARALAVARTLAAETGAGLRVVAAAGGHLLQLDPVREAAPDVIVDHRPPVDALVAESATADLVVVGSRGLHGFAALGSVSERVAHQAGSSVLVVRSA